MTLRSILTAVACILASTGIAQKVCLTDQYVKEHFVLQQKKGTAENIVPSRDTVPNEIITIPVIVHILFNAGAQNISDEQVQSQIDVLNQDFRMLNSDRSSVPAAFKAAAADSRIMFCLAKVDPQGRATSGINRKYTGTGVFLADDAMKFSATGGVNAWDPSQYLNIWVCNLFGRTLGYATPPGGDATKDGLVIKYNVFGTKGNLQAEFNKGRTATHEIAHWLGLKHIWGDDVCGSDEVDDTPRQKGYNFGCPIFPSASNCSPNADGDMFMNFMDLTSDACMNMFTQGQKIRMRSQFAVTGSRNSFLQSYKCDGSLATGAALPQDSIGKVPADMIRAYPNPAVNEVTIQSDYLQTMQNKTATIFTPTGVPVLRQVFYGNKETIKLNTLLPGIYILSVGEGKERKTVKLVKL
jgi:hypothetical protein